MRWGWTCNATWLGRGKYWSVTIPTQHPLIIQGCRYSPGWNEIEIWGTLANKNVAEQYNDPAHALIASLLSRQTGDGGTERTNESYQPKESVDEEPERGKFERERRRYTINGS